MRPIRGLRALPPPHALLLDQFGVIHDGRTAYPRAVSAIHHLHALGTKILILSNSSREAAHAREKIVRMGVRSDAIHAVITSGELALAHVSRFMQDNPRKRVLHLNWGAERGTISSTRHGIQVFPPVMEGYGKGIPDPGQVDVVVAHGTDGFVMPGGDLRPVPVEKLKRLCVEVARANPDVPFFCANPDFVTVDSSVLRVMPGELAKVFEEAGGRNVVRLGKPGASVYEKAREILGEGRVLAVGDSIAHDVLGAVRAGVECLYIAGGIHAEEFGIEPADGFNDEDYQWKWDENVFERLKKEEAPELTHQNPTYVCPFFRW